MHEILTVRRIFFPYNLFPILQFTNQLCTHHHSSFPTLKKLTIYHSISTLIRYNVSVIARSAHHWEIFVTYLGIKISITLFRLLMTLPMGLLSKRQGSFEAGWAAGVYLFCFSGVYFVLIVFNFSSDFLIVLQNDNFRFSNNPAYRGNNLFCYACVYMILYHSCKWKISNEALEIQKLSF